MCSHDFEIFWEKFKDLDDVGVTSNQVTYAGPIYSNITFKITSTFHSCR